MYKVSSLKAERDRANSLVGNHPQGSTLSESEPDIEHNFEAVPSTSPVENLFPNMQLTLW